ncbi:MAG: glycosyltransferase family 2 protein [Acidithiobacillus ferrivorans]
MLESIHELNFSDFLRVGIVLLTFKNDPTDLLRSTRGSRHILQWYVHDHSSSFTNAQGLISNFRQLISSSKITLHMLNRGVAASWNCGIYDALNDGCDIVLVVNDDIVFDNGGFDDFIEFSFKSTGDICFAHGRESTLSGVVLESEIIRSQGFACFSIKKSAIERIGYFDENFFPAYFEDTDYWFRMKKDGVSEDILQYPILSHARGSSTKKSGDDIFTEQMGWFYAMNENYFFRKWGDSDISKTYTHPFDDKNIGFFIPFESRRTPYGIGRDRDLAVLDLLESSPVDVINCGGDRVENIRSKKNIAPRIRSDINYVSRLTGNIFFKNAPESIDSGSLFCVSVGFDMMPELSLMSSDSVDISAILRALDSLHMFLSYHWYDDFGTCVIHDGLRSKFNFANLFAENCGEHCMNILAPEKPGIYNLCVTLIHEGVDWLEGKGVVPCWLYAVNVV